LKKIIFILIIILVIISAAIFALSFAGKKQTDDSIVTENPAVADDLVNPVEDSVMTGVVTEITSDGFMINTEENGIVSVKTGDDTEFYASGDIACGDFVYIDFNGAMTRSIPVQITAERVCMFRMEGDITGFDAENNSVTLETPENGEVIVNLPGEHDHEHEVGQHMIVYHDGAMTMSLPAQVSAGHVICGYAVHGAVTEKGEGYFLLGEGMQQVHVLISEDMDETMIAEGNILQVIYDGQMTRSVPPQITASDICVIAGAE